jgi:hypothetical protein
MNVCMYVCMCVCACVCIYLSTTHSQDKNKCDTNTNSDAKKKRHNKKTYSASGYTMPERTMQIGTASSRPRLYMAFFFFTGYTETYFNRNGKHQAQVRLRLCMAYIFFFIVIQEDRETYFNRNGKQQAQVV